MINQDMRIRDLVPQHYLSEFPKFVEFLEIYYEWQYQSGAPGFDSKKLQSNQLLEREFDILQSADDILLMDSEGKSILTPDNVSLRVQEWVSDQGHYLPLQFLDKNRIDEILFVRLIRSMHLIKGTSKATELFFHLFFNENIIKNNPHGEDAYWNTREAIAVIDSVEHKIDNINNQIRDDDFFNEFSYAIYVKNDYPYYKDLFENVYLKYIHPAGFKPFLIKHELSAIEYTDKYIQPYFQDKVTQNEIALFETYQENVEELLNRLAHFAQYDLEIVVL